MRIKILALGLLLFLTACVNPGKSEQIDFIRPIVKHRVNAETIALLSFENYILANYTTVLACTQGKSKNLIVVEIRYDKLRKEQTVYRTESITTGMINCIQN